MGSGLNVFSTNGALCFPFHPFTDTEGAETVGAVQGDSLQREREHTNDTCHSYFLTAGPGTNLQG